MTSTLSSSDTPELFGGDIHIVDFLAHDDTETFKTSGILPSTSEIGRAARAVNTVKEQELFDHFSKVRYDPIQDEYFEDFEGWRAKSLEAVELDSPKAE